MSTKQPNSGNRNPNTPRPGGSGQRPAQQKPASSSQRSSSSSQRPTSSSQRPNTAARPGSTPSNRVQVRGQRPPQRKQQPALNPMIVAAGVGGVLIVLVGLILLLNNPNPASSANATATAVAAAANNYSLTPAGDNGGLAAAAPTVDPNKTPAGGLSTVKVETDKGNFTIHLFTDDASVSGAVKNFQDKVQAGFFDGKTFHRVEDWVVQGGDPAGNGTGGGDMAGEYNARSFLRGAVGMASTAGGGPIVNDSQWFVVKTDATWLDTQYVNFAQVTDGMDVVDQIAIGDKMNKLTLMAP